MTEDERIESLTRDLKKERENILALDNVHARIVSSMMQRLDVENRIQDELRRHVVAAENERNAANIAAREYQAALTAIGKIVCPVSGYLTNEQIVGVVERLLDRHAQACCNHDNIAKELAVAKEYCEHWQDQLATAVKKVHELELKDQKTSELTCRTGWPVTARELAILMHRHEPAYGGVETYEKELEQLINQEVEPGFVGYNGWSLKEAIVAFVNGERDRRRLMAVAKAMSAHPPCESTAYYERELQEMVTRKAEPNFSPYTGWDCWQQIVDYVLMERAKL